MDDEIFRAAKAKKGSPFLNTGRPLFMSGCPSAPWKRCGLLAMGRAFASMGAMSATTSTTSTSGRWARSAPLRPTRGNGDEIPTHLPITTVAASLS